MPSVPQIIRGYCVQISIHNVAYFFLGFEEDDGKVDIKDAALHNEELFVQQAHYEYNDPAT